MIAVFRNSWALFLGMFFLMVGNGVQGTLLGLRGTLENFSTLQMSIVMSAYFAGFLGGSRLAPEMIRRVGHVRVFAALGSLVSAVLILYPVLVNPWAWTLGRVLIGFCLSGVYVTAESWLNNSVTNELRGKALSAYMVVQLGGIVAAQYLLLLGDVSGFVLFIVPSILVSLSFAPILLSVTPTPAFDRTKPMSIRQLIQTSPLACTGMFLLGGVFAAQFGMVAVYGGLQGFSVPQISVFASAFYISALLLQYPIGYLSDRMDRRRLIIGCSALGALGALIAFLGATRYEFNLVGAVVVGGLSNPLYALLIAYANDYLEHEDMPAASAGFVFINGLGAVAGPIGIGWVMSLGGPAFFWAVIGTLMAALAVYGVYRMTRRPVTPGEEDRTPYAPVLASASPVAVEAAQEYYIETELSDGDEETSS